MSRPSKSQLNKLGERLRKAERPAVADLQALDAYRVLHLPPILSVTEELTRLGVPPTWRLKTRNTLIEKLRREKSRLTEVQDIGGLRVVVDHSLSGQDRLRDQILSAFPGSRVIDRRQAPRQGYRALHIVVELDAYLLELQLRTHLQHVWAQEFENLADRFGRGLRYGELSASPRVRDVVEWAIRWSELIEARERGEDALGTSVPKATARPSDRALLLQGLADLRKMVDLVELLENADAGD